jgi:hypothetical protein
MMYTTGFLPQISDAWAGALAIAEKLGDTDYQLRAIWGLWTDKISRGQCRAALELSERFLDVASAARRDADVLVGDRMTGYSHYLMGQLAAARLHIERMLKRPAASWGPAYISRYQFDQHVLALSIQALILWVQGFPSQAMGVVRHTIDEASSGGHALSLIYVLAQSACPISLWNGDLNAAEHFLKLLADQIPKHAPNQWSAWARCYEGMIRIARGELEAGACILASAVDQLPMNAFHMGYLAFLGELADAFARLGDSERALTTVEKGISEARSHEQAWCLPELLRVKGEILLRTGHRQDVEEQLQQSLSLARQLESLSWELRAGTSLARLWQEDGRGDDASSLLIPIYRRFSEGLDTSDLRAARMLLDSLGDPGTARRS